MKKILILALAVLFLLPVLPAYAAERTTVDVATYNNVSEDLIVSVITTDNAFEGAIINIGESITYTLSGNGKGTHTAQIDISSLETAGEIEVEVMASYGGEDVDTVTKNIVITKVETSTTDYNIVNVNLAKISTNGSGNCNIENAAPDGSTTEDESAMRISWGTPFVSEETYVSMDFGAGANTTPGIYIMQYDIMFQNGNSTEKEVPDVRDILAYFRTTDSSAKPTYSNGKAWNDNEVRTVFGSNGKLANGDDYTTNVWYRVRFVIDKYTKDTNGNFIGGMKYYIATADDNGNFGDFKLLRNVDCVLMPAITRWRHLIRSQTGVAVVNFKNMKFIRQIPIESWYVNNFSFSGNKATIEFSEDLGQLSADDFKVFNKIGAGDEIEISTVTNLGSGVYEIETKNPLFSGNEYDILIANGLTSPGGAKAFNEPENDENGDGFWKVKTFTAPSYALNIESVEGGSGDVTVTFTNDNTEGKYIIVTWLSASGKMVDYAISAIDENVASPLLFSRTNSDAVDSVKAYVIDISLNGIMNVYDIN